MAWRSTREIGVLLRQALRAGPARSAPASRVRQTAVLAVGHVAAGRIAVERQEEQRVGVARMGRGGEAEGGGQARLDAVPAAGRHPRCGTCRNGSAGRAGRAPGGHGQVVHALAGLGVALLLGQVSRSACRGCGPPRSRRHRRCGTRRRSRCRPRAGPGRRGGHQRVQDQAAAAGLPVRARGMLAQPRDMAPGLAAILAAEQAGGLDAGIDRCRRGRRCSRPT